MGFTQEELEEELEEIDAFLRQEKIPIPGRPLRAITEFSKKHKIGLPISEPIQGIFHESYQYWSITEFIMQWFDDRYGGRLGMDMGPGKCAFLLRGDPWVFHFPKFWGSYRFGASRKHSSDELAPIEGIAVYNIFESVKNLPSGLRESTTDAELQEMLDVHRLGLGALSILDEKNDIELIKSASADIEAAVSHIMSTKSEYGLSKWSSLQATEKVLKGVMQNNNLVYKKTHDLNKLAKQLDNIDIEVDIYSEIVEIQCLPSIRYGEESLTLEEAVKAHHASLRVILNFKDII